MFVILFLTLTVILNFQEIYGAELSIHDKFCAEYLDFCDPHLFPCCQDGQPLECSIDEAFFEDSKFHESAWTQMTCKGPGARLSPTG
ncbi:hypothetical protein J6590_090698 [Homalodisca vitripennis]|nr:hypothetical protein J6590_090698 [Homalodisca vitripennis]